MISPPRRPNYFEGRLLTAADLQAEQDYHRNMRYLHNRWLHGTGVIDGFEVSADGGTVAVTPGLALDPCGREVILGTNVDLALPPAGDWLVVAHYTESPSGAVPNPVGVDAATDGLVVDYWEEGCEVTLEDRARPSSSGVVLAAVSIADGGAPAVDAAVRKAIGRALR